MSVAEPVNGTETEATVPQQFSAFESFSGEDSDMNVQATQIAALMTATFGPTSANTWDKSADKPGR